VTSARQTPSLGQLKLMLLWDSLRGDPHAGKQLQIYSFRSGDSAQSHEVLLKLAEKSGYSAEVYNKLEEFFTPRLPRRCRLGFHRGEASRMKRISSRLGSFLLDWLVDYGRHPWQAGVPCAVLIALCCVLFSPKKMEPQKPDDTPRVYSRFWFSLGLFLSLHGPPSG
jgi:hypothetical protein